MIFVCLRFFLLNNVHFLWEAISPAIWLKWADLLSGRQGGEYILPPLGFCTAFLYLSNELDWQQNNIWILDLWPTEFSILSAASGVCVAFLYFSKVESVLSMIQHQQSYIKASKQDCKKWHSHLPPLMYTLNGNKNLLKWKYCAFMFDLSGWFPWKKS